MYKITIIDVYFVSIINFFSNFNVNKISKMVCYNDIL
jgi:hypothetical protein